MIYLVRHGEAAAGWGSHPNPGLSDTGQSQANAVAETLTTLDLKHAFTSPMQRCQETGAPFANRSGLALTVMPAVTEIPTPSDIEDRVTWLRTLMSGEWSAAPEIVQDWRTSLIECLENLPPHSVVFTHFVAINAIVGYLDGTGAVTVFRPNYCSLTKIDNQSGALSLISRGKSLETKVL